MENEIVDLYIAYENEMYKKAITDRLEISQFLMFGATIDFRFFTVTGEYITRKPYTPEYLAGNTDACKRVYVTLNTKKTITR